MYSGKDGTTKRKFSKETEISSKETEIFFL